ncbi:hypothetical protein F8388_003074 [Cannabis sativa]|uniref:Uncharacterized protein n=1 Tax=Cannabis sativa TaxID=3483 RepID=A0A7J6HBL9_CANSA|nr:hypothetical protein F8388_003074 [Cannabis sativa]
MGANMQYNSYFSGYHSARNLNLDANASTWPLDFNDKVSESGNYYNGYLSPNYLLTYNKELLKQTMLKHETIFKDQIQELHRLYRRQMELMSEIRRNELHKSYSRFESSHSDTVFFQTSSEQFPKTFQVPKIGSINPADSPMSISGSEKLSPLISVQGKNIQVCSPYSTKSEVCSKDFLLSESKDKKFGKKSLDLQLTAVEYFNGEDKVLLDDKMVSDMPEKSSQSVKTSPQVVYTSDVKSFFGSDVLNSLFHATNKIPASILEKQEASIKYSLEESFQNTQKLPDLGPSNFVLAETERKEGQLSCHDKSADFFFQEKSRSSLNPFHRGLNDDKLSSLSGLLQKDRELVQENSSFHQGNHTSFVERGIYDLECSRKNDAPSVDKYSGPHGTFSENIFRDHGGPQVNITNSQSSILALKNFGDSTRNPVAVQALPCFNTSAPLDKRRRLAIGRLELDGDSKLVSNHDLSEHKGSFNLNSRPQNFSSEFVVSKGIQPAQGVRKCEYSVSGFDWLGKDNSGRGNSAQVEGMEKCEYSASEFAWLGKDGSGHGNSAQVESLSLKACSVGKHVEPKNVEALDSLSKLISGSHDSNKSYISDRHCSSSSNPSITCQSLVKDVRPKGKVFDLNLACDSVSEPENELTVDEHAVEDGVGMKPAVFGCLFDLNSSINDLDAQELALTAEIDFDAPPSPENKECSPPRGESDENQVETPLILSGPDEPDLPDELTRIAADAIVSISSSRSQSSAQITSCKQLETISHDSLLWFAGIASTVLTDSANEFESLLKTTIDDNSEELLHDGMDYFEAMTLKLTETEMEDFCCKSNGSKEEETGTSSSPTQQRKGRTRRGKQRKDFQREILPSLASLSRYEVTEDLQIIGGLMEAAGTHWETGSMRYATRNGYSRGRKRGSIPSSSNAGVGCSVEPLLKQLNSSNNKLVNEERSVVCWGKVTRRRRGQRCPVRVSNPHLILSQV